LTRGASKQTSQDAEAEAATTLAEAEAVVLLLAETGDHACRQRRPIHIHTSQLNFRYQRSDSTDVLTYIITRDDINKYT